MSHVSQKSFRASCLCTGQKTGRCPDAPTASVSQGNERDKKWGGGYECEGEIGGVTGGEKRR